MMERAEATLELFGHWHRPSLTVGRLRHGFDILQNPVLRTGVPVTDLHIERDTGDRHRAFALDPIRTMRFAMLLEHRPAHIRQRRARGVERHADAKLAEHLRLILRSSDAMRRADDQHCQRTAVYEDPHVRSDLSSSNAINEGAVRRREVNTAVA